IQLSAPGSCGPGGCCFKQNTSLVNVENHIGAALADHQTAGGADQQPILLQTRKRLADRCPANLAPLGQSRLYNRLTWREVAGDDGLLNPFVWRRRAGRRRGRMIGPSRGHVWSPVLVLVVRRSI